MDDCCRLAEMLFGATTDSRALTIGFLEIISPVELSVTAVYAATDADSNAVSIDVEQINAKKVAVPRLTTVSGTLPHTDEVQFNENGGLPAAVFVCGPRSPGLGLH
jgi:hypothetical protein